MGKLALFGFRSRFAPYIIRKSLKKRRTDLRCKEEIHPEIGHNSRLPSHSCHDDDKSEENNFFESLSAQGSHNEEMSCVEEQICNSLPLNHIDQNLTLPETNSTTFSKDDETTHFVDNLRKFVIMNKMPHALINKLMDLLKTHKCFHNVLPKDCRTLLGTQQKKISVHEMDPGIYYHFGMEKGIRKALSVVNIIGNEIELDINIDGLPLTKSSTSQFYPILGSITCNRENVFLIGLYWGKEKPKDSNSLIKYFVEELNNLIETGLEINKKVYNVRLHALLADAPAKAYILKVKSHTGHSSCTKCEDEGVYLENHHKICFPYSGNFKLRTKESFLDQTDDDYHKGSSLLLKILDFDPVKNVPLDYQHLICLGIMRKFLDHLWVFGKPPYKLKADQVKLLNDNIVKFANQFPAEFVRRPRGLSELKRWKAVEYRTFLLYLGPIVLKNVLSRKKYSNFMNLHVSIYILSHLLLFNDTEQDNMLQFAERLLFHFVEKFNILYGNENMTYNVHNLLHIVEDVKKFGCVDHISCFKYENFLQNLKKLVRKGDKALPQVVQRITEMEVAGSEACMSSICLRNSLNDLRKEHVEGPVLGMWQKQFKELKQGDRLLRNYGPNRYCQLKSRQIVQIHNFILWQGRYFIIGRTFNLEDFYSSPCPSSNLKIYSSSSFDKKLKSWPLEEIENKVVVLRDNGQAFLYVMIHC